MHNTIIKLLAVISVLISLSVRAELKTQDFILSVDTPAHNHIRIDEIDKIINSKAFTPLGDNNTFANGSPWLKVEWNKNKIKDEKFIINDFTSQAYEDYYLIKDNKMWKNYSSGFTDPFDIRPIKHFKFVADVSEVDYILVKTCCNPGLPIYFRMLSTQELNEEYYHDLIWYAVVYSLIAMMLIYNLFIFLYLKEKQYLYYCYYMFSMLFILLTLSGIGKQFFWPSLTNTETFYFISGINVSIASILFQLNFLSKKHITITNKKLMYLMIGLHFVVLLLYFSTAFVDGMDRSANLAVQIVCSSAWFITIYVIVRNILAGDRSAYILLFCHSLVSLAGLIFLMRYNGYLTNSKWAANIVDIAVLVESLILSIALAQKIQTLKDEKSLAEKKQLKTQKLFSRQLLALQEEEKKQLSSVLHDNFTHQLLILKTGMAKKMELDSREIQQVDKILNEIRDLSHVIHPYLLEKLGLKEALLEMIEKTSQTYDLDINFAIDEITLSKQQNLMIYRIIQESINNIIKHANATECVIAIRQNGQFTEVIVKDDGDGFDSDNHQGLGLTAIKERCNMLKAVLTIKSDANGSIIDITFPNK